MIPFWLTVLGVFLTTLIGAWCWTVYIKASAEGKALRAALADCAIIGLGMFAVIGYTEDHRLALPILLAAFMGTYYAVRK